ncbi:uncharacterized protein LAESUDRAFT_773985 [Laetiporus sulphureus 93-53]|uniref:Uncharacterized protein n=1 Tax=Laetiporus sulphureus 93-53 TaxID=1314785 RepID=A0A165EH64_9APHY|nr:uncharacterized protein LAESUDRAFT_773985 [Laetiporus sulphureus 93-53]KZT07045.1 hypothetical protein LAESUDRAFT_773985 [Laetiporus sulphureus 93-53]
MDIKARCIQYGLPSSSCRNMSADSSTIGSLMHPTKTIWTPEFVENEDVSGRTDLSFSPSIGFHESRSLQLPMLPKMVPNSVNDTFPHNLLTVGSKCTARVFLWSKFRAAYYRCFNVDPDGVAASVWMAATVRKELWSVTASGVRLRTYMVEVEGHASVLNLQVVPFFGEMWTEGWPPGQAIGMYKEPVMQALRVFVAIPTITNFQKLTRQPVIYCAMIVCCDRLKHIKRGRCPGMKKIDSP